LLTILKYWLLFKVVFIFENPIEKLLRDSLWAHRTAKPMFIRYMSFQRFFEGLCCVEYVLVGCIVVKQFFRFHDQTYWTLNTCVYYFVDHISLIAMIQKYTSLLNKIYESCQLDSFLHMCCYMLWKRSHFHAVIDLNNTRE